jgi:serine/threonine protein phosphatase PrpC
MLLSAFYRADARIRNLQGLGTSEMGATVVACVATENEVLHLHAGDCRIFHFSGDRLAYVSHDHSVVQALVDSGIIDEQDAVAHPMRNAVTSCVGGPSSNLRLTIDPQYDADDSDGIQGDSAFRALSNGDVIVMCSDGLWSEVGRDKMWAAVKRTRLTGCVATELSAALLQLALAGPATDNITAIVIDTDRLREGLSQRRREKSSLRAASRVTGVLAERNMDNP